MRIALLACLVAACDPLADSDYVGEPMFTLAGTLISTGQAGDVGGLALMWQDSGGAGGPGVAATIVPVENELTTLRIAVPLPPPDAARFGFDDTSVELAEAYVFVVEDPASPRLVPRGIDRSHVLVFATEAVPAGSLAADYLGGAMTAGYHLRRFVAATPGPAQLVMIERCVASRDSRAACEARRGYRLEPIADDDQLRIVVAP
jgi:hypothetical protein